MTFEDDRLYQNVQNTLKRISTEEGFMKPLIKCRGKLGKGQGFMGDVFYVTIIEENSNKTLDLVIKQSTSVEYVRKHFPVDIICFNESYIYKEVYPKFLQFQLSNLQSVIFDNLAKCYATDLQEGQESFVLENLNTKGYFVLKKDKFFDKQQAEFVLKKYGQFHGLSFAYKTKHPEEFQEMSNKLIYCWKTMSEVELFKFFLEKGIKDSIGCFDPEKHSIIIKKLEDTLENGAQIFQNATMYRGNYGVIVQGDCWSNNILFKYEDDDKIADLKLIDFQMSNINSVVNDLSYCLYAGGTQEIFENFDHYLQLYHDSLADTCSRFGCKDFISFDELKSEWKEYCKFGFILGLGLIQSKLSEDMDQEEMSRMTNTDEKRKVPQENTQAIKQKCLELVLHMYENDFL